MSGVQLLDKTRKIGKLLHNNNSSKVVFTDICNVMQETLSSNVLVISRKGKILGISDMNKNQVEDLIRSEVGKFIDPLLNERMLAVLSTKENVNLATLGFEQDEIVMLEKYLQMNQVEIAKKAKEISGFRGFMR